MSSAPAWVEPWDPSPHLRPVRHQFNNLLAPVVVAAELLDDGSETADLLARAVDRIRDVSNRLGELLRLQAPDTRPVPLGDLVALCGLPTSGAVADRLVRVDPERVLCNIVSELRAIVADDPGTLTGHPFGTLEGAPAAFQVSVILPRRIVVADPALLAVPFALPGADVRLATVCRETHLHGGRVSFDAASSTFSAHLPLV